MESANKTKILLSVILLIPLLSGCIGINSDFRNIRNSILELSGNRFHKEIEFSVGAFGLMVAGNFVKLNNSDENIDDMLDQITRVQIGIYERKSLKADNILNHLREVSNMMKLEGWKYLVRSTEGNEMSAVFLRAKDNGHINRMFVVALTGDELILTEVSGNLEKLIELAIKDRGLTFDIVNN